MKKLKLEQMEMVKGGIKSLGQRVQDCVNDAYSSHGFVSGWLSIQSAFIPQTTVAIYMSCLAANSDPD